ncbi:MAG: alkaline phosphatase family protein [Vicinamibacterales bacterium]
MHAQGRVPVVLISGRRPEARLRPQRRRAETESSTPSAVRGRRSYSTGVRGVTPTVTYPSHTTLLTGVSPPEHGIRTTVRSTEYQRQRLVLVCRGRQGADAVGRGERRRARHRERRLAGVGRRTCPLQHRAVLAAPIAKAPGGDEDHKPLRALSTPGLLDEAEHDLVPILQATATIRRTMRNERRSWRMIAHKKPDLLTGYFASLDEAQHAHGPYDQQTLDTVERIDTLIGQVRRRPAGVGIARRDGGSVRPRSHPHRSRRAGSGRGSARRRPHRCRRQGKVTA